MQISELFKKGISFDDFIKTEDESYKEKILDVLASIEFDQEYIERIESIDQDINILISGELWCADCLINIPVIEKMKSYNDKIHLSIVTKEDIIESGIKPDTHIKLPTFIVYDAEFKELGIFIEHPRKIKEIIEGGNESNFLVQIRKYRKGGYASETLKDVLYMIDRRN